MADENQMDQGPAVPPQAKEKVERGVKHVRKAAEDLRSAAGVMADEYRGRAEGVLTGRRMCGCAASWRRTASGLRRATTILRE